jgi:hypothetical protein
MLKPPCVTSDTWDCKVSDYGLSREKLSMNA